jgi:Ca2+-binding RTX toxin-like protein
MIQRLLSRRMAILLVLALLLISAGSAMAESNSVPASRLGSLTQAISVPALAPAQCSSIAAGLTNLVIVGSGTPGDGNDLILGTDGADVITAGRGNDCIVAGGGNDIVDANQGNDVILGGPGDDDMDGGPGTDRCVGGDGTDTARRCETTVGVP